MKSMDYVYNIFLFSLIAAIVLMPAVSDWWVLLPVGFVRVSSEKGE